MSSIELTPEQETRIATLRDELDAQAGPYARVTDSDVLSYLLDLEAAVDDPDRTATPAVAETSGSESFPVDGLRARLAERNRRHSDPDAHEELDLYSIAAAYDITGRSQMTKAELIDAIVEAVTRRYTEPLAPIDLSRTDLDSDPTPTTPDDDSDPTPEPEETPPADTTTTDEDDATQLRATLSLLEEHDEKWREADGDARYQVDLPDGSTETARTKDDVRAVLFNHY